MRLLRNFFISGLLFGLLALPALALAAGQTITIDASSGGGTGTVSHNVYGNGESSSDGDAPNSGDPTSLAHPATDNTVNINGGVVSSPFSVSGGYVESASGSASAGGNTVRIENGASASYIYGGYAKAASSGYAAAAGQNKVEIVDGSIANAYGGWAFSDSGSTAASGNSLTVSGGSLNAESYGGYADSAGGAGGAASAVGNHVFISGGTINTSIFGGYARSASGGAETATGNSVTISGAPNFTATAQIWGGKVFGAGDARSGNAFNLHSPGLTVNRIGAFENWNFYLPAAFAAGQTMLTVTAAADLGNDARVNVGIAGSSSPLQKGDTVTLIDASAGTLSGTLANDKADGQGLQGVTLKYAFDLYLDTTAKLLTATVSDIGPQANERAKALSEGFISGLELLNQGGDLAAGAGLESALRSAAQAGASTGYGLAAFGALSGGKSRYNAGSHTDLSSVSLLTGLAAGTDLSPGRLTLGGFFEYGRGSYDTYNSFSSAASVHGDGDLRHLGGGVLGRLDFQAAGPGRFHAEASARAGRIHNDYSSSDLRDAQGRQAGYEASSAYFGLHLGTGYLWDLNDKTSLDLYGQYFWTRQAGDDVTLSTGDPVKFKDADSRRLRFGSRAACAVNEYVAPYIGAAWEYEFDGEARATAGGLAINAPSLRGGTGIGELGLSLKPSPARPLSFDLGMRGYAGGREGVSGSLQIKYEF